MSGEVHPRNPRNPRKLLPQGPPNHRECRRTDFGRKLDEDDNANEWLMIPLVGQLVAFGMHLQPGQCYGFKIPPVLGGQYVVENCGVLPIADYLGAYGSIHDQLRDVPDGSQVVLRVGERPG